jgi:hypothetical protein
MCTDAYREALTRDLTSTASPAPASASAPSQRHATEAGRERVPASDRERPLVTLHGSVDVGDADQAFRE